MSPKYFDISRYILFTSLILQGGRRKGLTTKRSPEGDIRIQ